MKELKIGDLVRVTEDTHDARMPPSRTGLIVETIIEKAWNDEKAHVGVYMVYMTNGERLKFQEMFLEKVEDEKQD